MENETPMPMSLIAKNILPLWLNFYEHKVNFNSKMDSMPKKTLIELGWQKWSKEKIATFNQYQIEFGNKLTPLEFDIDEVFE